MKVNYRQPFFTINCLLSPLLTFTSYSFSTSPSHTGNTLVWNCFPFRKPCCRRSDRGPLHCCKWLLTTTGSHIWISSHMIKLLGTQAILLFLCMATVWQIDFKEYLWRLRLWSFYYFTTKLAHFTFNRQLRSNTTNYLLQKHSVVTLNRMMEIKKKQIKEKAHEMCMLLVQI
jgi:hypothetical protein